MIELCLASVCQNCCPDDSWRFEGADVAAWKSDQVHSLLSQLLTKNPTQGAGALSGCWKQQEKEEERFLCTVLHCHLSLSPPGALTPLSNCRLTSDARLAG